MPVRGTRPQHNSPASTVILADGIEVFPRQDDVAPNEFGNAVRGPLGIHRGSGKRYWFYGADYTLDAQIAYLTRLKRITENEMYRFVSGVEAPKRMPPPPTVSTRLFTGNGNRTRREFSILEYVRGKERKVGRNYFTRCPACARQGRDKSGDNLAICIADPRKYKCWAGCAKEEIRAALGCPIRHRKGLSA